MKNNIFGKVFKWQTTSRFAAAAVVIIAAVSVYMGCEQGLGVTPGLRTLNGTVTVIGTPKVGVELEAVLTVTDPAEMTVVDSLAKTYRWQKQDGDDAAGWEDIARDEDVANPEKYTPGSGDVNCFIRVEVTVSGYRPLIGEANAGVLAGDGAYAINTGSMTNGTVTANPATADDGDTVTLTVSPASGLTLTTGSLTVTKVSGGAVTVEGSGNTYTFTMPGEPVNVTAAFEQLGEGAYSISVSPLTGGAEEEREEK